MQQYAKITPQGTKDYLFEECYARAEAQRALTEVFERYGYAPVATPHLEFHDVFRRASADWLADRLYSAADSRARTLVLRPDSTLPIARVAATRLRDAQLPLRLYYHQSVFRRTRLYSGNGDEQLQSGVEFLGAAGLRADLEILACAAQALRACGANFCVELGHADIFKCLAEGLGADGEAREGLAACIESKNLPALKDLLAPYGETATVKALLELPRLFGGAEVLARAKALFKGAAARKALMYLTELFAALESLGLHEVVDIDLGLVHGQQYYTGLVFRGYMEGSGKTVLSGGRYDGLLAEFGRPAAAVGFAIETDALAGALLESGNVAGPHRPEALYFGEAGYEAAALARSQQGAGGLCSAAGSLEEAVSFAKERGIPRVIVVDGNGERVV
ncbi:MAG: ATP phosphoribosyltransferase regulatory subunit [Oscillospiraceae bacterium]|jgi:ATP phosphoribosyltransferase regulatory subunit|nr:ATP phosphoribosyltransferase regulatory subunit [Oscillospiraceae bacterium]